MHSRNFTLINANYYYDFFETTRLQSINVHIPIYIRIDAL